MAKIEEITELLVNEISSFERGVERLEKVSDKLNSTKISIDIREFKSLLDNHQNQMKAALDTQERINNRFEKLLENTRIYPNWAVIVFVISLLLGIVSTLYLIMNKF